MKWLMRQSDRDAIHMRSTQPIIAELTFFPLPKSCEGRRGEERGGEGRRGEGRLWCGCLLITAILHVDWCFMMRCAARCGPLMSVDSKHRAEVLVSHKRSADISNLLAMRPLGNTIG